jgi:hypothetical protein
MDATTPSAGPAPVTFTPEQFRQLLDEALRIADNPETLLLPTRDHLRVLLKALRGANAQASDGARLLIALILSSEQSQVTLPADFVAATAGLQLEVNRTAAAGYVLLRVHTPAPTPGRPQ